MSEPSHCLSPQTRLDDLTAMASSSLDLLVIGGGITAVGTALDAASRGLRTGLIEATDFAAGTSSQSSKLVHGGLRYLEQRNVALVREALSERGLLLTTLAPHLVRPVPFLFPLTHRGYERAYVGAGVALYDVLAHSTGHGAGLAWHRHHSRTGALRRSPGLRRDALVGAITYFDAQVDDARLALTVARSARREGALLASRTRATRVLTDGGRVVGVLARDVEGGRVMELRARHVVNATGVWAASPLDGTDKEHDVRVRASKGVHLVVPRACFASETGIILRTATSVLFIIPWGEHWIIGTTDTPWTRAADDVAATKGDVEYLLALVNAVVTRPLKVEDLEGVYVGLRPLVDADEASTSDLSREHVVTRVAPGLTAISGGKYTTYRVMAKDVVDDVTAREQWPTPPSRTDGLALVGANGVRGLHERRAQLAREAHLSTASYEHLLSRYGSLVADVVSLCDERPALRAPVIKGTPYLRAEVVYAARAEGALHLDDLWWRRTRAAFEVRGDARASLDEIAALMGEELRWSDAQRRDEVARCLARIDVEVAARASETDDAAADLIAAFRQTSLG